MTPERMKEEIQMLNRSVQFMERYADRQFWWGFFLGIGAGAFVVHVVMIAFVWRALHGH